MRLIDADVLMEQMKRRKEFVGRPSDPVCLVEDAPTIDAVPVVHGHWEYKSEYEAELCTNCKCISPFQFNYCPHCGAKMDEVAT